MAIFYKLLRILILLVVSAIVLRYFITSVVFHPSRHIAWTPDRSGYVYENVFMVTSDDITINAWYINCENSRGTVLFFHGNAGNLSHRGDSIRIFNSLGMSVFIVSYRGYGESGGSPSIKGVDIDALTAWNWLLSEKKIPPEKILVFGRSLGGAVAVELMRTVRPKAAIFESTFSALADMGGFLSPIASLLVGGAWNSAKIAALIDTPTLCIHSPEDEVVPYRLGKRLYEALSGEKYFLDITGDHNSGFLMSSPEYEKRLDDFFTKYFGSRH
jgi:fermentation-respiration switch protein FrsA (DUF1100 family)